MLVKLLAKKTLRIHVRYRISNIPFRDLSRNNIFFTRDKIFSIIPSNAFNVPVWVFGFKS